MFFAPNTLNNCSQELVNSISSGGVAILFNNNFTFQLQRSFLENTGRFIIYDIRTNEKVITLATIYAPNKDDPGFFERSHDHLRDFHCDNIIIRGDFNLVCDIDRSCQNAR